MASDELPFLAELIDVAPGEERWRQAAEVTLGSVARILLVDETKLAALGRAIDPLTLPVRIHFEGVPLGAVTDAAGETGPGPRLGQARAQGIGVHRVGAPARAGRFARRPLRRDAGRASATTAPTWRSAGRPATAAAARTA